MEDITVEDVRDWLKKPVTRLFWEYLEAQRQDAANTVHSLLRDYGGEAIEAYKANVAMDTWVDAMELPERQMIPDLKEEKDET